MLSVTLQSLILQDQYDNPPTGRERSDLKIGNQCHGQLQRHVLPGNVSVRHRASKTEKPSYMEISNNGIGNVPFLALMLSPGERKTDASHSILQ